MLICRSESIHKQGPPCFAHQADTILYVNLTVSTSVINDTMYHRHTSFHEFHILAAVVNTMLSSIFHVLHDPSSTPLPN
jgi:hypothetical protein